MLKVILMDFDGVIIDSESLWFEIYQDWFKKKFGLDLNVKDFLVCVGASSDIFFETYENKTGIKINTDEFYKDCNEMFIRKSQELRLMNGVKQFVIEAKKLGLRLAIVTSAKRQKPEFHLKRLGLFDQFDTIISSELVDNIKPEPDLYLKALDMMGVSANECLVIEDSKNGLEAAKAANIPCVVVPNKITSQEEMHGYLLMYKSLSDVHIKTLITI